jgi:putative colanic acid biosynthesis acetyltransferase WcaF
LKTEIDIRKSVTPWRFRYKVKRFIWQYVFQPIFWLLPSPLSRVKIGILRIWGAKIGKDILIRQRVRVLMPWNLAIGNVVAIGSGVNFYNFATVTIDNQVVVSQDVFLCTGSHDYSHPEMPLICKPIAIRSYSWVAAGAFVGPGVTVGEGSVIGARSVVTKDTAPWAVLAGNPAKLLKYRQLKASSDSLSQT